MFLNFYYLLVLLGLVVFTLYGEPYLSAKTYNLLSNLAIGAIGAILGMAITSFTELRGKLWTCLVAQVGYHNTYIRVSVAYLFKIYVDGRYLLVRSRNVPGQFQPVGGVYKRLRDSVEKLNQLEVLDDKEIPICDTTRLDLRVRVKGKHLAAFIKWFESKEDILPALLRALRVPGNARARSVRTASQPQAAGGNPAAGGHPVE